MSSVRKFRVKSRFAALAFTPGGITASQALHQADVALEPLTEPSLALLDASIAEIDARYGPRAASRRNETFDYLYGLCSSVIDMSMFVPGSGVDDVARSFCGLVDLSQELNIWAWDAIDVHIEALKLLRVAGTAMSAEQRRSILDGLLKVTIKRVGDPNEILDRADEQAG